MSEAEAIEGITGLLDSGIASFTVFFSFTFAYLTVCYLVGTNLSRFQAVSISMLYVVSAAPTAVTVIGVQRAMAEIQKSSPSIVIDDLMLWDVLYWHTYTMALFVSVIILSLYFMYDIRRART